MIYDADKANQDLPSSLAVKDKQSSTHKISKTEVAFDAMAANKQKSNNNFLFKPTGGEEDGVNVTADNPPTATKSSKNQFEDTMGNIT